MTNEELLAKIKAEIERRIKECEATYPKDKGGYWSPEQGDAYAIAEEYKQLLSFLSTLEEQTKYKVRNPIFDECVANVNADVREEVRRDIEIENELVRYFGKLKDHTLGMHIALHFAEWGADHTPLPEDTVLFNKGVEEGRRMAEEEQADLFTIVALDAAQRAKQQMLKEARNHFIYNILSGNDMKKMIEIYNDEADCKPGDVVRVIIFKKEGEE